MKRKMLIILLGIVIAVGGMPGMAFGSSFNKTNDSLSDFSDMPNNWSKESLENAVSNGLLSGFNGKIMPKANLTRAQMAAIITRAFGAAKEASLADYSDVSEDRWYHDDMAKAVQMKVMSGSNHQLRPESNISRQEAFAVIARAFKLGESDHGVLDQFSDKDQISAWALDASAALCDAGYLSGFNGKLNPQKYITRAEFAKLMDGMLKHYISKAGTYSGDLTGNVMIHAADVKLSDMKITGGLIIGDGVGDGDVTLENVIVTGDTVVRGGGVNSIKITGSTSLQNIIIARIDGQVRVYSETGAEIGEIVVDGNDDVIIEGDVSNVTVAASGVTIKASNANIETAVINGENSKIVISKDAKIDLVTANGKGADISGAGKISKVEANADDIAVSTIGTKVTAAAGTSGVQAGTMTVGEGNTETVPGQTAGRRSGGNGNSQPGTPSDPADPSTPAEYFTYEIDPDTNTATITDYIGYEEEGGLDVVIPSVLSGAAVAHIGIGAFYGSGGKSSDPQPIESVVIPDSVISIGDWAFASNLLTTVTIPDSVTSIGESAFESCDSLTDIMIGSGVNSIGQYVFSNCSALESIAVSAENAAYSSSDGVLFDKNKQTLLQFPKASALETYTIPDSVTTIGALAFSSCDKLTAIEISDSVISIGNSAFQECYGLTSLIIPDGVTSIGDGAFSYCANLAGNIVIPNGVTSISNYIFVDCVSLGGITIPDGVTSIGEYSFANCQSLSEITIPNSVENISGYAFQGCAGLSEIVIPNSVTSIGASAFGYCSGLESVTLSNQLTALSERIFTGCSELNAISIPDSVTSFGRSAFSNCSALTSITIPDGVGSLPDFLFYNCTGLASITLNVALDSFGSYSIIDGSHTSNFNAVYTGAGTYTRSGAVWSKL